MKPVTINFEVEERLLLDFEENSFYNDPKPEQVLRQDVGIFYGVGPIYAMELAEVEWMAASF